MTIANEQIKKLRLNQKKGGQVIVAARGIEKKSIKKIMIMIMIIIII